MHIRVLGASAKHSSIFCLIHSYAEANPISSIPHAYFAPHEKIQCIGNVPLFAMVSAKPVGKMKPFSFGSLARKKS